MLPIAGQIVALKSFWRLFYFGGHFILLIETISKNIKYKPESLIIYKNSIFINLIQTKPGSLASL